MVGKVQRSFTGSDYGFLFFIEKIQKNIILIEKFKKKKKYKNLDHVAMILRFGNSDLVVLEATENNVFLNNILVKKTLFKKGVGMFFWKTFLENQFADIYAK